MSGLHIFRVTVRGRFSGLSERQRTSLVEALDDHHVTRSAYTDEGTFTYDSNLYAFSLRFEIRLEGEQAEGDALERGLKQAETFLRTLGIGYEHLKVTATDMQSMWDAAATRRRAEAPAP